ncbi:MAG: right-handed parallel beta-helix repeat-containing protein [Polyangiaceae bacterium]
MRLLLIAVAWFVLACGTEDDSSSGGGAGTASGGTAGSAGVSGSGGTAGSGAAAGAAGTGGSGASGPVDPPVVCTDQCLYVRPGATGSGSGSDWDDAFPTLPDSLVRGKVYLLADGDYGSASFDDATSGSQTIALRKATAASHGTNTGWDPNYGDGVALFSSVTFSESGYELNGSEGGGFGAWTSGHGIEITRTGTQCGDNGALIGLGAGVSDIIVKHVHAHAGNNDYPMNGVKGTAGASKLTFAYNSIHTIFGPTFHIGDWQDVVIEHNHLADVRSTGGGDPFCPDWHAEGISSIGANQNLTIRYNLWDQIQGTAVFAGVNSGSSKAWKIYGNVFSRSTTTLYYYNDPGTSNLQSMDDLEFHNNVITQMPGSSVGVLSIAKGTNNVAYDNIWFDNVANTFSFSSNITHDFNYFADNRRVEGCSPVCDKNDEAAAGEGNAQIGSGSPFVNAGAAPEDANFHLQAGTNPGKSLPAPFDLDPSGAKRGADGSWDRGVFEWTP